MRKISACTGASQCILKPPAITIAKCAMYEYQISNDLYPMLFSFHHTINIPYWHIVLRLQYTPSGHYYKQISIF